MKRFEVYGSPVGFLRMEYENGRIISLQRISVLLLPAEFSRHLPGMQTYNLPGMQSLQSVAR
jgi:hypothetical protein